MEKIRYGIAAAAVLGVSCVAGCGGSSNTVAPIIPFTITPTLSQFAYVATTDNQSNASGGIQVFDVAANGTVTADATNSILLNGGNVANDGLAVSTATSVLVAAIDTGANATSGLQVFSINTVTGTLTPGTLVAVNSGTGAPQLAPAGAVALDASGTVGVFEDTNGNLEGFTVDVANLTVTVNGNIPEEAQETRAGTLSITTVGGQDVLVSSGVNGVQSFLLSANGTLSDQVTEGLGNLAATTGTVGVALSNNTEINDDVDAQSFDVADDGTLTVQQSVQFAGIGASQFGTGQPFNAVTAFTVAGVPLVAVSSSSPLTVSSTTANVFLSILPALTPVATGDISTGTPVGLAALLPSSSSGGVDSLLVVSQATTTNVAQVSSFTLGSNNALVPVNTAVAAGLDAAPGTNSVFNVGGGSPIGVISTFQ